MEWMKRMWRGKAALTLATWVAYALAFLPLYRLLGAEVTALVMFPVIVTGWRLGTWGGLLAGLLGFLLDVLLLTLAGEAGWQVMTGTVAGTVLLVVGGTVVGRLCDLGERAKDELARRVQTEAALRRERDFAEGLIETAQAVVLVLDTEGRIVRFNPYMEELSGYRLEEVLGKDWFTTFLPTRDQQRIREAFSEAVGDIQTRGNVNPIVTKDGREREIEWYDKTLKDSDGNVTGLLAVGQDITERVQAEEALQRRTNQLSALNSMAAVVTESLKVGEILDRAMDEALRQVGVEVGAILLLDRERDELVMAVHRGVSDEFVQTFSRLKLGEGMSGQAAQTGRPVILECLEDYPQELRTYVARERIQSAAAVPLVGSAGVLGAMKVATDAPHHFDPAGIELLMALGRQIATGIEKVRLRESERKAAAAAAAAQTAASIVEAMADGVLLNDLDGRITFVNPAFEDMTGYDESELIGDTAIGLAQRLVKPEDLDTALDAIGEALAGRAGVLSSVTLLSKEGKEIPVAFTMSFVNDAEGQPASVTVVFKDVTELKRAQVALRESERWLSTTLRSIGDAVLAADPEGRVTFMNPVAKALTGWEGDSAIGRPVSEVFHIVNEDTGERAQDPVARVLREGVVVGLANHTVLVARDGTKRPIDDSGAPIQDGEGNITGAVLVFRDVTERREMQAERDRLFNLSIDMLCVAGFDGFLKQLNPAWSKTLGWTAEELRSKPWLAFVHPDDHEATVAAGEQLISGEPVSSFENRYLCKDGSYRWMSWNCFPLPGEDLIFAVVRDVTGRKQAEEELRAYSQRLEKALEQLREAQEQLVREEKLAVLGQLAGGVGHELRNPLGVISNAVYFLQMVLADADERTREYLGIIGSEVRNAEKIVSDLLDLSRTRPAEREEVALSELVAEALEKQPPPEGVEVTPRIASDLPILFVDRLQIRQVLANLVANAYQAMPEGGELTLSARADGGRVCLSVTDTGYGISRENMGKIFEPLFTTRARGIGLGLAVSRNLVQVNGGTIEVQSEEGQGSTFTVALPTGDASGAKPGEVVP